MKVIQSYWSLPNRHNDAGDHFGRKKGGWQSEKYHAMSWSLSCHKFRQFYPEVVLYSDSEGRSWLNDKLGLPFTNIVENLDCLNNQPPALWSLSKVLACSLQTDPFFHADGDVYIWRPFHKAFVNSTVFAQNIEYDLAHNVLGNIYLQTRSKLESLNAALPYFLKDDIEYHTTPRLEGYNTGILGGQDVSFFSRYAKVVFDFLDANVNVPFESRDMNFIEQLLLLKMAQYENLPVNVLMEEENAVSENAYSSMMQFNLVPLERSYVHVVGAAKKDSVCCQQVAMRLKYEFPHIYNHIQSLYPERSFFSVIKDASLRPTRTENSYFENTLRLLNELGLEHYGFEPELLIEKVEHLTSQDSSNRDILFLADVYQYENFFYQTEEKRNKEMLLTDLENNSRTLLDFLYESSGPEFLNLKFTLNNVVVKIITTNFQFPKEINFNDPKSVADAVSYAVPLENPELVILFENHSVIHSRTLMSWDLLLAYFDDREMSGNDLIEELNGSISPDTNRSDVILSVISFLTTNSLYYNYLKPVNHSNN